MVVFKLLLVLAVGLVQNAAADDSDELKAVVVLFRHGDRSPLSSWPNDVYYGNTSLWPDGYGQLNNLGKERHYKLGQWFRERYGSFLPERYNRKDIYVQSTDVDRTLQSAAANLAGLYPPVGDQIWNDNLLWQPVSIHTIPESNDAILATTVPCAKHSQLINELKNSEEFQQLSADLSDFFSTIAELTGYGSVGITSFPEMYTDIVIYREFGWSLPEWTDTYFEEISRLAALVFQLDTYTTELARLKVGPFFDFLIGHLRSITTNELLAAKNIRGPRYLNTPLQAAAAEKFLMLSAHDSTLADRLNAMGLYNDAAPEFSSTVIWEMREGESGHYINLFFKNSTHFEELTLPGCSFDCAFDDFVTLLEPITVSLSTWTEECNA